MIHEDGRWIPIDEDLPEIGVSVVMKITGTEGWSFGYRLGGKNCWIALIREDDDDSFTAKILTGKVTHWYNPDHLGLRKKGDAS